jgi:ABC-2 type transport system ATP-binding protein
MISIRELHKKYGRNTVLRGIDLDFDGGRVYGIVGHNGAGKTTLFNCIAGLETYDGEISSAYQPLKDYLGYLETNPQYLSHMTGWEYLKLVSTARGIQEEEFEKRNIFQLPLNEYASTYSTGMKKKLALMGVLLRRNEVFILDEPFNGVDLRSNLLVVDVINKLKAQGKLILISSHIFMVLREVCDEIHLLEAGKFVMGGRTSTEIEAMETRLKSGLHQSGTLDWI